MKTMYEQETELILGEAAHFDGWFTAMDLAVKVFEHHGERLGQNDGSWYGPVTDRLRHWAGEKTMERMRLGSSPAYSYRWVKQPEVENPYEAKRKSRNDVLSEVQRRLHESDLPALSVLRIAGVTYDVIYDFNYGDGVFPDKNHMPAKGTAGTPLHQTYEDQTGAVPAEQEGEA